MTRSWRQPPQPGPSWPSSTSCSRHGLQPYEKIEQPHDPLKRPALDLFGREIARPRTIHGKKERHEAVKEIPERVVAELAPAGRLGPGGLTALQVNVGVPRRRGEGRPRA